MFSAARYLLPVLGDEKFHHRLKKILTLIFAPLALILALFFCILSGGASHNCATVDLCFSELPPSQELPAEYQAHLIEMQEAFSNVDSSVTTANSQINTGNRLNATEVKAVFYALTFEKTQPNQINAKNFVDCFVTTEKKDGEDVLVSIQDKDEIYANLSSLGFFVTTEKRENAKAIYSRIATAGDGCFEHCTRPSNATDGIDISGFTSPSTKNAHDLAAYGIQAYENGWGYVWGTFGDVLTDNMLQYKINQYPDGVRNYASFIWQTWLGSRTADCVGLIKGYSWLNPDTLSIDYQSNGMPDLSADRMYRTATVKGSIESIPETPGLAVWHSGHIGVYIGNGEVIEAMGTHYGVVKTQLSERNWTAWLQVPHINYD